MDTHPISITDALATIPRALTALVYQHRSLLTARKFAHSYFLGRDVDLRQFIKFRDPKMALSLTVNKFQRERPISRSVFLFCEYIYINIKHSCRLLKETGRLSNSPTFVVGIYSGRDKLGEGFGSSLKMAEFRVRNALSTTKMKLIFFYPGCRRLTASTLLDTDSFRSSYLTIRRFLRHRGICMQSKR